MATTTRLQNIISLLSSLGGRADPPHDLDLLREKFFVALYHNDLNAVNECIKEGVDVNKPATNGGLTALHFAAAGGSEEIINLLLKSGANSSAVGSGPSQGGTTFSTTPAVVAQAKAATTYSPEMKAKFERIAKTLVEAEKAK